MPSTFSSLKIELIATGEQSGTWGVTTNTNLGTAIEEAITGSADVTFTNGNDTTVTLTDTNAAQAARNLRLNLIGSSTGAQNLILGSGCQIEKLYLINNTLGHTITVKNTTGTGIAVPAGKTMFVYNNGTNVVDAVNHLTSLSTGAITSTQVNITGQGDLRLEDTTGGEYVALQAPGTLASSYTLTLPVDDGTNGQALITDGNGVLSWSTAASGDVYGPASATDNAIARYDGATGKLIQNSVVTIADTTGNMTGVGTLSSGAITSSSLTSGRVLYAGTSGLIQDDADFTFNGTTVTMANDASISGLTVGKGGGAVSTNTVLGLNSGTQNSTGANNTYVGWGSAFWQLGSQNTALGHSALNGNTSGGTTTGSNNTAVGYQSLLQNTTASNNTAVGYQSLYSNTTGTNNTSLGYQAGYSQNTGNGLTAIGFQAARATNTGNVTAVGLQAALNNTSGSILAVGDTALYNNTTGTDNTAIGSFQTMYTNTTGSYNVAVGRDALRNNTTASYNTAVGLQAMYANTTGQQNVGLGYFALYNNTTGSYNSVTGLQSMALNTTGSNNTAQGYQALYSNTTASNNTAVGYQVLYSNTTGANNIGFGSPVAGFSNSTLFANTTGAQNNAFGSSALSANTTGLENSAFGYLTLLFNTTGSYNTAYGNRSLYSNTTANNNTAVGYQALYSNTASNNTAVGFQALFSNTATENSAFGRTALYSNTTGTGNNSFGFQSLYSNTTGTRNSAFGYNALVYNTTGGNNTAFGYEASLNNTTASNNTAVGYQAGYSNTTGTQNTFVGYQAGLNGATGDQNTYVGFQAGLNSASFGNTAIGYLAMQNISTGYQNQAFGRTALRNLTTGFDNAAVGNNAGSSLTTGSANNLFGSSAGSAITTGSSNTIIGSYTGNQGGLDIRTANSYIVLSDGGGNPQVTTYNGGSVSLAGATPKAGTGITFPATQSASSDANTLDDYEEGTWTPTIAAGGGYTGVTYSIQNGNYTKIGRLVNLTCYLQFSGSFNGSTIQVASLPFQLNTASTGNSGTVGYWDVTTDSGLSAWCGSSLDVIFYKIGSSTSAVSTGNVTNKFIIFSITGWI